ncbi:hypothetical protein AB5J72_00055 [Streptomyces sp. CG1]|uniref:hypothetical protein n=1 Tax=Streptomyces sp. CG1 TaxID=1287523 RepID=UPI0034E1A366
MFSERTSVGLDVHARSTTAWALDYETGEVFSERLSTLSNLVDERRQQTVAGPDGLLGHKHGKVPVPVIIATWAGLETRNILPS